jgi:hypothetical protein
MVETVRGSHPTKKPESLLVSERDSSKHSSHNLPPLPDIRSSKAHSSEPVQPLDRKALKEEMKKVDTLVDTFLIMGPSDENLLVDLAKKLKSDNHEEIQKEFKLAADFGKVKPIIVSKYPDFKRHVTIDTTVEAWLSIYAYKKDYNLVVSDQMPEDISQATGFSNGGFNFCHGMAYTFYEDLRKYSEAHLEFLKDKQR